MADVASYFAPCINVNPGFDDPVIDLDDFRMHRRVWDISTFDLATLATKHKLHIPYQLMDTFLSAPAHLEIEANSARSRDEATARFEVVPHCWTGWRHF